jgi:hypothetical protein
MDGRSGDAETVISWQSDRAQSVLSSLIHVNDFAPFIKTAFRADAMLHARLLTVRAQDGLRHAQRIMRATFAATCF